MLGIVSGRASFLGLRASLLAALGLGVAACSGGGGGGGGGGNAGSAGSAGSGGTGGAASKSCDDATPILQPTGEPSGFVKCADGSIDRVEQVTCVLQNKDTCLGTEETLGCTTAADCVAKPNGVCLTQQLPGGTGSVSACGCVYPCQTDADCGAGKACVCAGVSSKSNAFCSDVGACAKGADCASGECGYTEYSDGCNTTLSVVCRDSADECRTSAGCIGGQQCSKTTANGAWTCMDQTCTIGRPLLVGDALLFAPAVRRADWADEPLRPDTTSLTPEVRAALAAHFTAMAAMEHASIGSFARFALELLALGAPPALLRATHEAAADEVVHARLAYSLASAYAGEPIGPGRLCVTGVAPSTDERAIVRALVREACVGETVAAAEALTLSGMVEDPALASGARASVGGRGAPRRAGVAISRVDVAGEPESGGDGGRCLCRSDGVHERGAARRVPCGVPRARAPLLRGARVAPHEGPRRRRGALSPRAAREPPRAPKRGQRDRARGRDGADPGLSDAAMAAVDARGGSSRTYRRRRSEAPRAGHGTTHEPRGAPAAAWRTPPLTLRLIPPFFAAQLTAACDTCVSRSWIRFTREAGSSTTPSARSA